MSLKNKTKKNKTKKHGGFIPPSNIKSRATKTLKTLKINTKSIYKTNKSRTIKKK